MRVTWDWKPAATYPCCERTLPGDFVVSIARYVGTIWPLFLNWKLGYLVSQVWVYPWGQGDRTCKIGIAWSFQVVSLEEQRQKELWTWNQKIQVWASAVWLLADIPKLSWASVSSFVKWGQCLPDEAVGDIQWDNNGKIPHGIQHKLTFTQCWLDMKLISPAHLIKISYLSDELRP